MEERGLRISRTKTEYLRCGPERNQGEDELVLGAENIERSRCFKYLGTHVDESGGVEREINSRVQAGWKNWRDLSGVLCDRKVPVKVKGKLYKSVVRPALMYGMETLPMKKLNERKMEVTEMKMLRWMCGVTRNDRIRNEYIRGTTKVTEITNKIQEARLRWYGHVRRRDENYIGRRMLELEVPGRRRRGRPKKRWRDCIQEDVREKDLEEDMVFDRREWKRLTQNSDPI